MRTQPKPLWRVARRLFIAATSLLLASPAAAQFISEYAIPTPNAVPCGITVDATGNVWFAEFQGNNIGMMTPLGAFTEFAIPTANSNPCSITVGPDGNLWFTEVSGNKIGTMTPGGMFTEYTIPTSNVLPRGITVGADGNLWFRETANGEFGEVVAKMTTAGALTEYFLGSPVGQAEGIALGPDGNVWFEDIGVMNGGQFPVVTYKMAKIAPDGSLVEYPLPGVSQVDGITTGPDGNLWFTFLDTNVIGTMTTSGAGNYYVVPTTDSDPYGIAAGPDGNVWFVEHNGNNVSRIAPGGSFAEFPIPTASSGPFAIAAGLGNVLWFTEGDGNQIGKVDLSIPVATVTPTPTATVVNPTATPTLTPPPSDTPTPTATATPACGTVPALGCRKPTAPLKSTFLLKSGSTTSRNLLLWKWTRGMATLKTDFGDPTVATQYALCVYDTVAGVPTLKVAASIPGGGMCAGRPCWSDVGHGFKYKDKAGNAGGIVALALKEGLEGAAKITLKAKGSALQMPGLPLAESPSVTVQLRNDEGNCWDADFTSPAVVSGQYQFRDKSD
jgi:sugar lactone lactonase YvrE